MEKITISVFCSITNSFLIVYIKFAPKTINIEINFYRENINESFHFTLFVKKGGKIFMIMVLFLYLCSHEKESDNFIISSSHNIWL